LFFVNIHVAAPLPELYRRTAAPSAYVFYILLSHPKNTSITLSPL